MTWRAGAERLLRSPKRCVLYVGLHEMNLLELATLDVAVGQNQWYHFGVGAPPILIYVSGDWGMFTGGTGF